MKAELVAALVDSFGEGEVSCESALCLNARHKDAGCRLCLDACPTGALALGAEPGTGAPTTAHRATGLDAPRIDPDRCVACGLCVQRCPVDALSERRAPETTLAQTVAQLSDAAIALVCPRQPERASFPAPVPTVVSHTRCLGALAPATLLELSSGGTRALWLDDSPCRDCPIGQARATIVATAGVANRLLAAFGRAPAIFVCGETPVPPAAAPGRVRVVDGSRPGLSRRGLFGALGHLSRRTVAQAVAGSPAEGPASNGPRLPRRLPPSRRALREQLARLMPAPDTAVPVADLPFAAVAVSPSDCSACGLCARFCPTGALQLVAEGERFDLLFQAPACLDCGLCARVCPERALHFEARLPAHDLVGGRARTLVAGRLAECAGCGAQVARRDEAEDDPRCFSCRASGGPAAPLRDPAGLLADLLGRLPAAASSFPALESEHGVEEDPSDAVHRTA